MSEDATSGNTTLDDSSPWFTFSGNTWVTNHTVDPFAPDYYNGTFHASTVAGDYARICWQGTDITLYGAKRNNHGIYATIIDDVAITWGYGYSSKEQIQAVLFASDGLQQGNHQLVIFNERGVNATSTFYYLDVDSVDLVGTPIDCTSLPDPTITPTDTIIPSSYIGATITASTTSTYSASSSSSTIATAISTSTNTDSSSQLVSTFDSSISASDVSLSTTTPVASASSSSATSIETRSSTSQSQSGPSISPIIVAGEQALSSSTSPVIDISSPLWASALLGWSVCALFKR